MSAFGLVAVAASTIPTPPAGEEYIFTNLANGKLSKKISDGSVVIIETGAGAVASVFGRTGAIVPVAGDYDASEITATPGGSRSGTDAQTQLDELDAGKVPNSHIGSGGAQHALVTPSEAGFISPADKSKLDGIEAGATANQTDAYLLARANHTGTQIAATISDFNTEVDSRADARILVQKGAANGLTPLDGAAKIPLAYIPASLLGATIYQGTWDASSNSPALASGVGVKGNYYVVNVPGSTNLDGISDWKLGDWAIYNGAVWEKVDNTDAVLSVNGKLGTVILNTDDIAETGSPTNKWFTDSRARAASVLDTLAGSETDQAPSVASVNAALATKLVDPMTAAGAMIRRNALNQTVELPIGAEDEILRVVSGLPEWVEENLSQDIGGGSNGNVTLSGAFTAPDILYYNELVIDAGTVFNPDAYIIYAKKLDLTNAPAGAITRSGNNGTNSANNSGGAGAGAFTARVLATNAAGGTGSNGQTNNGAQGAAGGAVSIGNGGAGGASGLSGAGGTGIAANAIAGGAVTTTISLGRFEYQFIRGVTQISGGAGGRGGNAGGGDGANSSRGGGGGGAGGAVLVLICGEIVTGPSTPAGVIVSKGGNGGSQSSAPAAGNVGGSSGGGGGGGGYIYIAYVKKTGTPVVDLIDASGGNGGNGSNGLGTGLGASGSQGGNGGRIQLFNITEGMGTLTVGSPGSNGTAGSGTVGGTGGQGGACKATL